MNILNKLIVVSSLAIAVTFAQGQRPLPTPAQGLNR